MPDMGGSLLIHHSGDSTATCFRDRSDRLFPVPPSVAWSTWYQTVVFHFTFFFFPSSRLASIDRKREMTIVAGLGSLLQPPRAAGKCTVASSLTEGYNCTAENVHILQLD